MIGQIGFGRGVQLHAVKVHEGAAVLGKGVAELVTLVNTEPVIGMFTLGVAGVVWLGKFVAIVTAAGLALAVVIGFAIGIQWRAVDVVALHAIFAVDGFVVVAIPDNMGALGDVGVLRLQAAKLHEYWQQGVVAVIYAHGNTGQTGVAASTVLANEHAFFG